MLNALIVTIALSCPKNEDSEQEVAKNENKKKKIVTLEDEVVEGDMEVGSFVTYQVYNSVYPGQRFNEYDPLLDNQGDISVIQPHLLREII